MDKAIGGTFIIVLLVIAYGAFAAATSAVPEAADAMVNTVDHALERHPTEAAPIMTAVANDEVLVEMVDVEENTVAYICQPDELVAKGKVGVQVCDTDPDHPDGVVTAFENRGPIEKTIGYLERRGYVLVRYLLVIIAFLVYGIGKMVIG